MIKGKKILLKNGNNGIILDKILSAKEQDIKIQLNYSYKTKRVVLSVTKYLIYEFVEKPKLKKILGVLQYDESDLEEVSELRIILPSDIKEVYYK